MTTIELDKYEICFLYYQMTKLINGPSKYPETILEKIQPHIQDWMKQEPVYYPQFEREYESTWIGSSDSIFK